MSGKKTEPSPQGRAEEVFLKDRSEIPGSEPITEVDESNPDNLESTAESDESDPENPESIIDNPEPVAEVVGPIPQLHVRQVEIRLSELVPGDYFQIGDELFYYEGTDIIGIQVREAFPEPGGFRKGLAFSFGYMSICKQVIVT